jgi:drug/metabolite transporter (DMT)-like permease
MANPLAAALLAIVLLDEPITIGFLNGLAVVFIGIWIAGNTPKAANEH